ncbi:hypothetical protein O9992_04525 [Vibrio lentus]|nr:hypothetical protein [Vibrio lentus]
MRSRWTFTKIGELTFLGLVNSLPMFEISDRSVLFRSACDSSLINAANEIAVDAFLNNQVKFTDIAIINEHVMSKVCEHCQQVALLEGCGMIVCQVDSHSVMKMVKQIR